MGHYLCQRRLSSLISEGQLNIDEDDEQDFIDNLNRWLSSTADEGTKDEFDPSTPYTLWNKVNVETDTCTRIKCPFFSHCFFL